MGLTFLQQLITVGCLAFASGLMLGIAFFRGEVGNFGRTRFARPYLPADHEPPPARRRRKGPAFRFSDLQRGVVDSLRGMDPALMWVLIALALLLLSSAVITRMAD